MALEAVKDEIDAQSGRFEFLKQALTLGLAGLAGTAAFFTDTSKIPSDAWSIGAVITMGVALLTTVGASLMGISVYANLLKAHAAVEPVEAYRTSMVQHAQYVFVAIGFVAVAFVVYAGLQVAARQGSEITSMQALALGRKAMLVSGCDATLETLSYKSTSFVTTFHSRGCNRRYTAVIRRKDGEVLISSAQAS